jgi:hypothetical protein
LLDRNNVTGSLGPACNLTKLSLAIADCLEVDCDCCVPCCTDGIECHDLDLVSSMNPIWERNYERQFFDFDDGKSFSVADDDAAIGGSP